MFGTTHLTPRRTLSLLLASVSLLVLAACGSTAATSPATPTTGQTIPTTDYRALPQSRTSEGYHVLGDATAPVTLETYSDFLCGACSVHVLTVEPEIIAAYVQTGEVRIIYRHLGQVAPNSILTGEASECAADQGQFWEMRELLYNETSALYSPDIREQLVAFAAQLELDTAAFAACLDDGTHREQVVADYESAQADGVQSRPVFDINEKRLVGNLPFSSFREVLDEALQTGSR